MLETRPPDPPEITTVVHTPESTDGSHCITRLLFGHATGHGTETLDQGWSYGKQDILQGVPIRLVGEKLQNTMAQPLHRSNAAQWEKSRRQILPGQRVGRFALSLLRLQEVKTHGRQSDIRQETNLSLSGQTIEEIANGRLRTQMDIIEYRGYPEPSRIRQLKAVQHKASLENPLSFLPMTGFSWETIRIQ